MNILDFVKENFKDYRIRGKDVYLVCPFHDDSPPGHLSMDLQYGIWHCFHSSCNASGNFKKLIDKIGLGHYEDSVVIEAPQQAPPDSKPSFLKEATIAPFMAKLPIELLEKGFSAKLLKDKGIGVDSANHRYTFPIRDFTGKLVGLSGRAIYPDMFPKYKFYTKEFSNTFPEYSFKKSHHLYNIEDVYPRMQHSQDGETIIIVEGYKACHWMIQNGFRNTVAIMGSMISKEQAELLARLTNDFTVFFDNDEAGRGGALKSSKILERYGTAYIVSGNKKQPDNYTKEELKNLLNNRVLYLKHLLDKEKEND